jgi:DNA-binding transcriptional LysR family regulator
MGCGIVSILFQDQQCILVTKVCAMEMHQIRYFLAVSRTLNFTHAADECHVAQPSLSRAIKKLEEELGGDLFRRERALTHLTELGRMMLPLLSQSYESAMSAKTLASNYRKAVCAPLRIALSHTINLGILVRSLTELVKALPGLELSFFRGTANEISDALKSDKSELAIAGPLSKEWARFDVWPLFVEPFELVLYKSHPLAERNQVHLDLLATVRLLPRPYCELFAEMQARLAEHGLRQSAGDQVVSDQDMLTLLESNVGVSIMPSTSPRAPSLKSLRIDGLDIKRTVFLYSVAGRKRSPAAATLVKLLRAADWTSFAPSLSRPPVSRKSPDDDNFHTS